MSLHEWFQEKRKLKMLTTPKPKYPGPEKDPSIGLWVQCNYCETVLYVKLLKQNKGICENCGSHLLISSSERLEMLTDPGTWKPLDEDMTSCDVLDFVDEVTYRNRLKNNQMKTGLTDAVQTGRAELNGNPIALGVMDFQFMGGSMGSVVGEKLTRLIEYAIQESLPLIIVCASGGARMQEGTLSLMQMAKIASALQIYQMQKKLLYISILTYPTTGGVTASFGMLGDIIMAEPKAYIAFAGKRVIEQTLRQEVPDGFQVAEALFEHGLLDLIVPRVILKGVLGELFELYNLAPCKLGYPKNHQLPDNKTWGRGPHQS
uniref:Acetyl-coenzyme A carboxylase carboxyl transferase subunit beta, chloroplastic n=1 Tax=Entransia fimbriata TaxID=130991 RepID=A0A191T4M2_9VIRI|nr:beta subunit of acetyl-CoA carboxylase carboxytransferase [Entransia fimbriata]YP_009256740.1 beta subunit of acetyl-CoA carboxylase carboxytransferase [Entransia fimbriata]ANI25340.1 beta subunit of acetyl-CoA carboxylase carboxytransferase [Entransia fimbriata]ANI25441.1 beta subunit of acetyl-CoA carboxylase carboxytransferase [Entransia fimbriata]WKT05743.1 beta subunit of acetyl-CoA carboxylase carboxytransferase [Entransia fimbriata]WKT05745.1 beta subunit of acetyl-CoA carboxylase ca